jgi:hypothetical protein
MPKGLSGNNFTERIMLIVNTEDLDAQMSAALRIAELKKKNHNLVESYIEDKTMYYYMEEVK